MAINRINALLLTMIEATTFTGSYLPINPNGFEGAPFFLRINNNTSGDITVSYDGVTAAEYIVMDDVYTTPGTQANALPAGRVALFPIGQRIYVKAAHGTGYVYLSGFYQPVGE